MPSSKNVEGSGTGDELELSVIVIVNPAKSCVPTVKNEEGKSLNESSRDGEVEIISISGMLGRMSALVQATPNTSHVVGTNVVSVVISTGLV